MMKNGDLDYQDDSDQSSDNNDDDSENTSNTDEVTDESDEQSGPKNLAWADSISKILKIKPKPEGPVVLSKSTKLTEQKEKPKLAGFEVQQTDGKIKKEVVVDEPKTEQSTTKRKRKAELPKVRIKPEVQERNRERILTKIATKGVVQLFNAVRAQQKELQEKLDEAGPLDVKKAKVLKSIDKNTFLDVLMGEKSQNVDEVLEKKEKTTKVTTEKSDKVWNVLRDNYMMDAKLKDWDKEVEVEDEIEMA